MTRSPTHCFRLTTIWRPLAERHNPCRRGSRYGVGLRQRHSALDIACLSNEHMRRVFDECNPKDLALGLKDCDQSLRHRFLSNLSAGERAIIEERMASSEATRVSDVEDVRLRIVHQARMLEERGKVTITRGERFVY